MHHNWMIFTDLSRRSVDMGSIPFLSLSICLLLTFSISLTRSLFSPSCCAFGGRARPKCPTQRYLFLSLLIPLSINPALFLPHMPSSGCGWLERWGRSLEIQTGVWKHIFCTISFFIQSSQYQIIIGLFYLNTYSLSCWAQFSACYYSLFHLRNKFPFSWCHLGHATVEC